MRITRSIRQLTVLGFLLAVVPLILALTSASYQVDRLAVAMQQTVRHSAQAIEENISQREQEISTPATDRIPDASE